MVNNLIPLIKMESLTKEQIRRLKLSGIKSVNKLLTVSPTINKDKLSDIVENVEEYDYNRYVVKLYGKVSSQINRMTCRNNAIRYYFAIDIISGNKKITKAVVSKFVDKPLKTTDIKENSLVKIIGVFNVHYIKHDGTLNINANTVSLINKSEAEVAKSVKKHGVFAYQIFYNNRRHFHRFNSRLKELKEEAFNQFKNQLIKNENIPERILRKYQLLPRAKAFKYLNNSIDPNKIIKAKRTVKFDEYYTYAHHLNLVKSRNTKNGIKIKVNSQAMKQFKKDLPFTLTDDQLSCIHDILSDLSSHKCMQRLLQGDVGSGKTIVSAFGILACIKAGYQVALMEPTSVLAKQQYISFKKLFNAFNVELLLGEMKVADRKRILKDLVSGKTNLIVGTSSLIQKTVRYNNLGFVIIDEQQRFGTKQRRVLTKKGTGVNLLSMTATPIPRTFALASPAIAVKDVSKIYHLPKGRKPIKTKWIKSNALSKALPAIKRTLAKHEQVFVVNSEIKPQNNLDEILSKVDANSIPINRNSVESSYKYLSNKLPKIKIGVLTGDMPTNKKNKVMSKFASGNIQVLVSTTVVEVGIDVSNACLMVIMDAQRYGLSELHQLRGRVGRSNKQSYCLLLTSPIQISKAKQKELVNDLRNTTDITNLAHLLMDQYQNIENKDSSEVVAKRMQAMVSTTDGFKIAEADLKLRGSGDLIDGQKQHGIPKFMNGDPIDNTDDAKLFYYATRAVKDM